MAADTYCIDASSLIKLKQDYRLACVALVDLYDREGWKFYEARNGCQVTSICEDPFMPKIGEIQRSSRETLDMPGLFRHEFFRQIRDGTFAS